MLQSQGRDPQSVRLVSEAQQFYQDLNAKANIEILSPRYKALQDMYKQQREEAQREAAMRGPGGGLPGQPAGPAPQVVPTPAPK